MDRQIASAPGFAAPALADLDAAIGTAGHVALALILGWLGIVLVAVVLGRLPGRLGALARYVAELLTPRAARAALHAVMNLGVLGATVAAPATAAATPMTVAVVGEDRREADEPVPAAAARPSRSGAELPAAPLPAVHRPGSWPQLAATAALGLLPARDLELGHSSTPVVVAAGDSLWSIAAAQLPSDATAADIDRAWRRWYAANAAAVGPDPDVLLTGLRLVRPPQCPT